MKKENAILVYYGENLTIEEKGELLEYAKANFDTVAHIIEYHRSDGASKIHNSSFTNWKITCRTRNLLIYRLSELGKSIKEVIRILNLHGYNIYVYSLKYCIPWEEIGDSNNLLYNTLIESEAIESEKTATRLARARAKYVEKGGKVGRKEGYQKSKKKIEKQYEKVIKYLKEGYSIRLTAQYTSVSPSTIQRIKKEFKIKTETIIRKKREKTDTI